MSGGTEPCSGMAAGRVLKWILFSRHPLLAVVLLVSMIKALEDELQFGLVGAGFAPHGKSYWLDVDDRQIAVIAPGGRFSRAGQKCLVVCFRHAFLRDREMHRPIGFVADPMDYPVKLAPDEIHTLSLDTWTYRSDLLRYPYGRIATQAEAMQDTF